MVSPLISRCFGRPRLGHTIKKHFRLLIQRYAQFSFYEKGSGTSFSTSFCVWCFTENNSHVILYYWPIFIVWLSLLLEILGNMYIVIISCPVCDVINFEISHNFLHFARSNRVSQIPTILLKNKALQPKMKTRFVYGG